MSMQTGAMRTRRQGSGCSKAVLAMLLGCAVLAACSRVTAENYAKVSVGMPRSEVYEILGNPDEVSGGAIGPLNFSAETWKGSDRTIHVTFGGDKVALKSIGQNAQE